MRLQILGAVDLSSDRDGSVEKLRLQPKRLALLCYLAAAHPERPHRRDVLLEIFWPELDRVRARAALRQALHYVRRSAGPSVLISEGDEVGIESDRLWCDARAFKARLAEGAREQALELYQGDLLPGFHVAEAPGFERWVEAERAGLRGMAARAASELSAAEERTGNTVAALEWSRRRLALAPVDERALRRILTLRDRLGDRAGAEREYREFVRRLRREYELEPSPETVRVAAAIRDPQAPPARPATPPNRDADRVPSIAVLPFTQTNGDPGDAHIADGLADDVLTDLASIRGLRVVARTSTLRLRANGRDSRAVGRHLGVTYVLEGSVRREGRRLRVNARLVDTREGAVIWAERYSGEMNRVLEIQRAISREVVGTLRPAPDDDEGPPPGRRLPATLDEFECYHRARVEMFRMTPPALDRAVQIAREGIRVLGPSELLVSTLGMAYVYHIILGSRPDEECLTEARRCANRALELSPESVPGLVLRGMVRFKSGDPEGAIRDLESVREVEPDNRDALFVLAILYIISGRTGRATPIVNTLLDVDPLTGLNHCLPGYIRAHHGEFREALPHYERMLEVEPSNVPNRWCFTQLAIRANEMDRAWWLTDTILKDAPGTTFAQQARVLRCALSDDPVGARTAVTPQLAAAARWDEHSSWWIASALAMAGQLDDALPWLENAVRLGFVDHPFLSRIDPCLENLRGHPSFTRLMDRVREEWERLEN
ncbi:MAG: BTAD domain-containing putative transcriptional regulator [Longimicrobiales bacterium]|nr:BTAD domain-containing putative transcriptional regulator [Longimicrobiales bacterium]